MSRQDLTVFRRGETRRKQLNCRACVLEAGAVMQQDLALTELVEEEEEEGMKLIFNGVYFTRSESCFNLIRKNL